MSNLAHKLVWVVVTVIGLWRATGAPVWGQTFADGDVFVGIGNSSVEWRHGDGTLVKTLVAGGLTSAETTGMAFDPSGNLYVTLFTGSQVAVFDNAGNFLGTFGSGYDQHPESIVFDALNHIYVGQADGSHALLKFDLNGSLLASFTPQTEDRGTDWNDLAEDQCTMFYTSEGKKVKMFDVCTGAQLGDFNTTDLPGTAAYALRILPNGDVLAADTEFIVRLDDAGNVIQQYDHGDNNLWFALNLDPDGKSFWSADQVTREVAKFDIASGAISVTFTGATAGPSVAGITVKGEITVAQTPVTGQCVTRDARFWFTHALSSNSTECATLGRALAANIGGVSLGFLRLPSGFRNNDNVKDADDALIEALGLYYRSNKRTGELAGTQNSKLSGSRLCRERKRLAVELIAATANVKLLGTAPADCTYVNGGVTTNFPPTLLRDARSAAAGGDVAQVMAYTALLRKFNGGGRTNDFPAGLVECDAQSRRSLRLLSRDPTTQLNCPGVNDTCEAAEALTSFPYKQSVNLTRYTDNIASPLCGIGGPDAVWKIAPPVGAVGRKFTVDTRGSNFNTLLSIWQGTCSNLTPVACSDNATGTFQSQVSFRTDGTNTFFIVGEGLGGLIGKLKIRVTSP